jgi:hypothetical protein
MSKLFFATLFFFYLILSIAFIKLGCSLPLRTVLPVIGIICSLPFITSKIVRKFFKGNSVIQVAFILFISGAFSTLINVGTFTDVLEYFFKWILQPLLTISFTYIVATIIGIQAVFKLTTIAMLLTCIVGILQYFQFVPSWEIKYFFDSFQDLGKEIRALDELDFDNSDGQYDDSARPKGLSWSPIHLSYQACLMLGSAYWIKNSRLFKALNFDYFLIVAPISVVTVIASGTRSALLGVLILVVVHFLIKSKYKILYVSLIILSFLSLVYILPIVQDFLNLRVLQANDSSASMRVPLYLFGGLLFLNQPWGYGWIDKSIYHAQDYWSYLYHYEGATSIFAVGLHNYVFNILWTYGIFGLFALYLLFRYFKLKFTYIFIIGLIPYLVNSMFHNGGIFYGGNFIWFYVAVAKFLSDYSYSNTYRVQKFKVSKAK